MSKTTAQPTIFDRLMLALEEIENAEVSLRTARESIRTLFGTTLPASRSGKDGKNVA